MEKRNSIAFDAFLYKQIENDEGVQKVCIEETLNNAKKQLFKDPSKVPQELVEYLEILNLNHTILNYNDMDNNVRRLYDLYYLHKQCENFRTKNIGEIGKLKDETNERYEGKKINIFKNGKVKAVSTDLHGDMNATLFFLLDSGVAKFEEDGPSLVFFDMASRKKYESITEFLKKNPDANLERVNFLKPIPNLVINDEYKGQAVNCGDLVDRGPYSDEIVALFSCLQSQEDGKTDKKIIRMCGNHELLPAGVTEDDNILFDTRRELFLRDVLEDRVKLYYEDNGILYAHTFPVHEQLQRGIEYIEYFKKNFSTEFNELFKNFDEEEFAVFKDVINELRDSSSTKEGVYTLTEAIEECIKKAKLQKKKQKGEKVYKDKK